MKKRENIVKVKCSECSNEISVTEEEFELAIDNPPICGKCIEALEREDDWIKRLEWT